MVTGVYYNHYEQYVQHFIAGQK